MIPILTSFFMLLSAQSLMAESIIPIQAEQLQTTYQFSTVSFKGVVVYQTANKFSFLAPVDPNILQSFKVGEKVQVQLPLNRRQKIMGQIVAINSQSLEILFSFSHNAIVGMKAEVISSAKKLKITALPLQAISSPDGGENYVFIIEGERVKKTILNIWKLSRGKVLTLDKSLAKKWVVMTGIDRLVDGQKIRQVK